MTRDDIIRLAREVWSAGDVYIGPSTESLERFAALVAAAEREACAEACGDAYSGDEACGDWPTPEMCAAAIRARGNTGIKWEVEP
jgi:hypothetical protein